MQLIVNADDFGLSHSVNSAILQAHERGILTSASLMIAGLAVDEAVDLARSTPTLAVGLHLVMVNGHAASLPGKIPHLVDREGQFPDNPLVSGLRAISSAAAREETRRELEAQFARFATTGLALDHVDSHLHYYVHPFIFPIVLHLAVRHNAAGIRLPHDQLSLGLKSDPSRPIRKTALAGVFSMFKRVYLPKVQQAGLVVAERVFGLLGSGAMTENYMINLLNNVQVATAEIYFHPDTEGGGPDLGPNPGDLATLLSSPVRLVIDQKGIQLSSYSRMSAQIRCL